MGQIRVTTTVEVIEDGPQSPTLTITRALAQGPAGGAGNPRFIAAEVRKMSATVAADINDALVSQYGDKP